VSFDIRVQRQLATPPEVAFHHWIDADERAAWYCGDNDGWVVEAATDLRVGGTHHIAWGPSPAHMWREEGTFDVVEPPHRLAYTSRHIPPEDEGPGGEVHVTVTFEANAGGTLLTLVETGYPSAEVRDMVEKEFLPTGLDAYERTLPAA
jgi:uncharacterized protein YndB with AHSA1/START domain